MFICIKKSLNLTCVDTIVPDPDAFGLKQWLTMCGWIVLGIACYFSYCR